MSEHELVTDLRDERVCWCRRCGVLRWPLIGATIGEPVYEYRSETHRLIGTEEPPCEGAGWIEGLDLGDGPSVSAKTERIEPNPKETR